MVKMRRSIILRTASQERINANAPRGALHAGGKPAAIRMYGHTSRRTANPIASVEKPQISRVAEWTGNTSTVQFRPYWGICLRASATGYRGGRDSGGNLESNLGACIDGDGHARSSRFSSGWDGCASQALNIKSSSQGVCRVAAE